MVTAAILVTLSLPRLAADPAVRTGRGDAGDRSRRGRDLRAGDRSGDARHRRAAAFARRTGRNEAFNHAGNAVAAAIAGITAYSFGPIVVFWLLAAMAVASILATLSIPAGAIDHHVARGLDDTAEPGGRATTSHPASRCC